MKKTILFVDDEPNLLNALRRTLRPMREQWHMIFTNSAEKALEVLAEQPVDAVITDARMPGMDGIELLTRVSRQHPQVIRIILSGQTELEQILKAVVPTHQYLTKPCELSVLTEKLTRAFSLHERLQNKSLRNLVSGLSSIPTLPDVYLALREELASPDASLKRVGEIISRDMGLTAEILKLVNSAYFGLPRQVTNPAQAASYLGLNIISALVLSTQVFRQFPEQILKKFSLNQLSGHSLQTGIFAQQIARDETEDKLLINEAFTAGLLHDIGKLILASELSAEYREVQQLARERHLPVWQAEQEILQTDHAILGAYLLSLWGLPDNIVEALAFHHQPLACVHRGFGALTAVHVANALAHRARGDAGETAADVNQAYLRESALQDKLPRWQSLCIQSTERNTP